MAIEQFLIPLISVLTAALGSGGLWAFLQRRHDRKDWKTKLLLGLAHDRIVHLGMVYIERGYVTDDEYEDLDKYLWKPYEGAGGNGTAGRVMKEVDNLPMKRTGFINHRKEESK